MKLQERMAAIQTEAKSIRESLTVMHPNDPGYNTEVRERGERRIGGNGQAHKRRVLECARLLVDVYEGKRPTWHLKEAMSTSDFPLLFGDVLYRQLLGNYTTYPVSFPQWTQIRDLQDFRTMHMYLIDGGMGLLDKVGQLAAYPETSFTESTRTLAVAKYGRRYGISWEMIINDDLNAFQDRPYVMAQAARWSEEYLATQQLCDANGGHASFFTSGNANIVTSNPALSIAGLQTAFQVLAAQVNSDSVPIIIRAVKLVVPPSLEITARNILNATELRVTEVGGTSNQLLNTINWMKGRVELVVNAAIPIIATSKPHSWFLIADPQDASNRPAFVFGYLRGRREPQLFIKDSDQRSLGGGGVSELEGSFDNDSIDYKLRHVFGAAQGEPKMAVSSSVT